MNAYPLVARMNAEFIRTFQASLDARLWIKLLEEEILELEAARAGETDEQILKEMCDVLYVATGLGNVITPEQSQSLLTNEEHRKIFNLATRCAVNCSAAQDYLGLSDEQVVEACRRVHASNMSKLDDNGRPLRREDGKILKGPNYAAPDLSDLVAA